MYDFYYIKYLYKILLYNIIIQKYYIKNIPSVFPSECHYYISNQNGDVCVDPI